MSPPRRLLAASLCIAVAAALTIDDCKPRDGLTQAEVFFCIASSCARARTRTNALYGGEISAKRASISAHRMASI